MVAITGTSVILFTQNFIHQAPHYRDISLNAKYLVALINVHDRNQFAYLARQVLPEASSNVCEAYGEATQNPHGYTILDYAQDRTICYVIEPLSFLLNTVQLFTLGKG